VVQPVNTYEHHEGTVRGTDRAERNVLEAISGDFVKLDWNTMETLQAVLN
jgi:hypothetical protein